MAQTQAVKQQPVHINSGWFHKGYSHGIHGVRGLPGYPTEAAIVGIIQNVLAIQRQDGEISMEQLQYEAGILTGYLVSTIG